MELPQNFSLKCYIPFRMTDPPVLISERERPQTIRRLSERANDNTPDRTWFETETYETQNSESASTYPTFLADKKSPGLVGHCEHTDSLPSVLSDCYSNFTIIEVDESFHYWDWGVALSELDLTCAMDQPGDLKSIVTGTNRLEGRLEQDQPLMVQREFDALNDVFRSVQEPSMQKNDFIKLQLGLMGSFCFFAELPANSSERMELSRDRFREICSSITFRDPDELVWSPRGIFECIATGIGGQVLLERPGTPDHKQYQWQRARWLMRLVIANWTNLNEISDSLHTSMQSTRKYLDERVTLDDLDHRLESLSLNLLITESRPANIVTRLFDDQIYGGLWREWGGDRTVELIHERKDAIKQFLDESLNLADSEKQSRINKVLFVLNIITFASVIATIISVYELQGQYFTPLTRLEWILGGTVLFSVATVLFVYLGRRMR
jgi:hypothetical protein